MWAVIFGPDSMPAYRQRLLAIAAALLAGLFAFFFTGTVGVNIAGDAGSVGKLAVQGTGGLGIFALVLWWWSSDRSPIRREDAGQGVVAPAPAVDPTEPKMYHATRESNEGGPQVG